MVIWQFILDSCWVTKFILEDSWWIKNGKCQLIKESNTTQKFISDEGTWTYLKASYRLLKYIFFVILFIFLVRNFLNVILFYLMSGVCKERECDFLNENMMLS